MLLASALAAALLQGSVLVEGTTTCPLPAEVQALVLRGNGDGERSDRAELSVSDGQLRVRLLDGAGAPVNARELALGAPCSSLAAAAAAMINALELDLRRSPQVDIQTRPSSTEPAPAPASTARAEPAPSPPARVTLAVGAMLVESIADDALAPGAALTINLGSSRSPFKFETGFFLETRRQIAFDGGAASYQRFWLSLGPGYAVKWRALTLEGQLSVLGGLTSLVGDGRTSAGSGTVLEIGGALGLTAEWSFGPFAVSTGPFLMLWPGGDQVEIVQLRQFRALPLWDGLWGVGLRFGSG